MRTSSTITSIWSGHCIEFCAHEMFASCTAVACPAKYPDLVYKI
jgi:hypothetical protein